MFCQGPGRKQPDLRELQTTIGESDKTLSPQLAGISFSAELRHGEFHVLTYFALQRFFFVEQLPNQKQLRRPAIVNSDFTVPTTTGTSVHSLRI